MYDTAVRDTTGNPTGGLTQRMTGGRTDRPAGSVAVEAIAPGETVTEATLDTRVEGAPRSIDKIQIFTGGKDRTAPVFDRTELLAGDRISGPALIREANATTSLFSASTTRMSGTPVGTSMRIGGAPFDAVMRSERMPCPFAIARRRQTTPRCRSESSSVAR